MPENDRMPLRDDATVDEIVERLRNPRTVFDDILPLLDPRDAQRVRALAANLLERLRDKATQYDAIVLGQYPQMPEINPAAAQITVDPWRTCHCVSCKVHEGCQYIPCRNPAGATP